MTKKVFYAYFILYSLLIILNLDKLPVAWLDEVMLIDPAAYFMKTGHFASCIWPHKGTETVFLAYLPLTSFVHIINFVIFPPTLFFLRLPFALGVIITAFFLFRYYRHTGRLDIIPTLILIFLFINDEGITNAMRSGRVEMLLLALLASVFYLVAANRYPYLATALLSLLTLGHPAVWSIVAIVFLYQFINADSRKKRVIHSAIIITPVLLYLWLAGFDLQKLYEQLIVHGTEHDSSIVQGSKIIHHFWNRFAPTYFVQPYIIVVNLLAFVYCIFKILKEKNIKKTVIEICFITTSIYWIAALAPFYRYTPTLVLMIFLLLPGMWQTATSLYPPLKIKSTPLLKVILTALLIIIALPFLFRNVVAVTQWKERDAEAVYHWLDEKIHSEGNKILLVDAPVAFFYALQKPTIDFTLVYAVKKFDYKDYDEVYYLTHLKEPATAERVGTYEVPETTSFANQFHIVTYNGLRLYKIKDEATFRSLQRGYKDN